MWKCYYFNPGLKFCEASTFQHHSHTIYPIHYWFYARFMPSSSTIGIFLLRRWLRDKFLRSLFRCLLCLTFIARCTGAAARMLSLRGSVRNESNDSRIINIWGYTASFRRATRINKNEQLWRKSAIDFPYVIDKMWWHVWISMQNFMLNQDHVDNCIPFFYGWQTLVQIWNCFNMNANPLDVISRHFCSNRSWINNQFLHVFRRSTKLLASMEWRRGIEIL